MSAFKLAASAALVSIAAAAAAQSYPSRPVRVIVPWGVGGAPDVIARVLGEELSPRLSQPFVIENRIGAGGRIAVEAVAKAPADGYTLLLGSKDTHGVMEHLYPTWEVKPPRDLAPISLLMRIQNMLVANKDLKASNARELIALARQQMLNYGSPGVGTNLHLFVELLKQQQDLKLHHVPFRGSSDIMSATLRGELQLGAIGVPPGTPWVRDGRLKAIAVTGQSRSPFLADVPTFSEQGVSGHETGGWFALFAPSATPAAVQKRLNIEIQEVGKRASYRARVEKIYGEPSTGTQEELATLVAQETALWGAVVRKAGIRVE